MIAAIITAVAVGLAGPTVGSYLVQRKMSLLGDGIGHVALTGVALGTIAGAALNLSNANALAVPGAMIVSLAGALIVDQMQSRGRVAADVALALMFYGGAAAGVVLFEISGGDHETFEAALFGSLSDVSPGIAILTSLGAVAVIALAFGFRRILFAATHDPEFALASGIPVRGLTMALSAAAAIVITLAMQAVGLVLVGGLMIVPVAIAQLHAGSFARTMLRACLYGGAVALVGAILTVRWDIESGGLIVVASVLLYATVATIAARKAKSATGLAGA